MGIGRELDAEPLASRERLDSVLDAGAYREQLLATFGADEVEVEIDRQPAWKTEGEFERRTTLERE